MKYRGVRKDNGEWVIGSLVFDAINNPRIAVIDHSGDGLDFHEIHSDSIGMFTGLTDKNGKEIYGSIPINGVMSKGGDVLNHLTEMNEDGGHNGKFGYYEWNEKPVVFENGTFKCAGYITLENCIAPLRFGENTIYEVVSPIYEKGEKG